MTHDPHAASCCDSACACPEIGDLRPPAPASKADEVCCGAPPAPPSNPMERPGYKLMPFVSSFTDTPAGPAPVVNTRLDRADILGAIRVRAIGSCRDDYVVAPGLYGVGSPGQDSPVMVSANYKLSFDSLRKELEGIDAWILVLDSRGINVWCAAGKALFSTEEVVRRVKQTRLDEVVRHKELIMPQLGATGVSGGQVKKGCGFRVIWGPVRAEDIKSFLNNGGKADDAMRRVTFSIMERLVLIPVELSFLPKPLFWVLVAAFILSGIGSEIFSFSAGWHRGLLVVYACIGGIVSGAMATPALLPWIPGRAFALKGAITGIVAGMIVVLTVWNRLYGLEVVALLCFATAVSSYLAMNFTGATPYTSPTGVETEMRKSIPAQLGALIVAIGTWIGAGFI